MQARVVRNTLALMLDSAPATTAGLGSSPTAASAVPMAAATGRLFAVAARGSVELVATASSPAAAGTAATLESFAERLPVRSPAAVVLAPAASGSVTFGAAAAGAAAAGATTGSCPSAPRMLVNRR